MYRSRLGGKLKAEVTRYPSFKFRRPLTSAGPEFQDNPKSAPSMPARISQDDGSPHSADAVYEVLDDSAGTVLMDSVRKSLISVKIRNAEDHNDRTRNLLQQCIHLMPLDDQQLIETQINDIERLEKKLENTRSPFKRFFLIMKYKRVSRVTYLIVKRVSNRVINNQIKGRIRAATAPQAPTSLPTVIQPPATNSGSPSTAQGPSAVAAADATFNNVERAELTTLQSRTTGEPVVLMELYERDQRTQQFVASLQSFPPDDNTTDIMTDGGDETQRLIPDAAEVNTTYAESECFGLVE